jgi:lipopolysaccharide transport system permease protein
MSLHEVGVAVVEPPRMLTPQAPGWREYADPLALARNLWRHRGLIRQLAWREVRGRYQGTRFGLVWSVLTPLLMLLVYTFVFNFVLKVRWGVAPQETALEFALTLFCGLAVYNVFAETVGRAPGLIIAHPNFVKKVVFPLEVLPVSALLAALVHALMGLVLVGVLAACFVRAPGWPVLLVPLLLVPYLCFILGLSWFLASLGTFLRDLGPGLTVALHLLIFLTPVFYPLHAVPPPWRWVLLMNPLTVYVENTRQVLVWGTPPGLLALTVAAVLSLLVMQAGYIWFMKSKRAFADVV